VLRLVELDGHENRDDRRCREEIEDRSDVQGMRSEEIEERHREAPDQIRDPGTLAHALPIGRLWGEPYRRPESCLERAPRRLVRAGSLPLRPWPLPFHLGLALADLHRHAVPDLPGILPVSDDRCPFAYEDGAPVGPEGCGTPR